MKQQSRLILLGGVLLVALAAVLVFYSFGGVDEDSTSAGVTVTTATVTPVLASTTDTVAVDIDQLSTFKSKDPFVPQQVESESSSSSSSSSTSSTSSTTSTTGSSTTSSTRPTSTSTTRPPSTSSTRPPGTTSTTRPATHSIKLLSIDVVGGIALVTMEVDDQVYTAKKEGDILSTTWGQIKILEIDADNQIVVLLHGSEMRTLRVGQEYVK